MSSSSFTASHIRHLVEVQRLKFSATEVPQELKGSVNAEDIRNALQNLSSSSALVSEEAANYDAILSKLAVSLYTETLETFLDQASELENEAIWWTDVESKTRYTAMYFLQTLPIRARDVAWYLLGLFRDVGPQTVSVASVRQFFTNTVNPATIQGIAFPHLADVQQLSPFTLNSPLTLSRQECQLKRRKLEKLRNQKAQTLGQISELRGMLDASLSDKHKNGLRDRLSSVMWSLQTIVAEDGSGSLSPNVLDASRINVASSMRELAFTTLTAVQSKHRKQLSPLERPNRMTLIWPKLVFIPFASLILFRGMYKSRESLWQTGYQIRDTINGFWNGWVVAPLRDIFNTVRAGGDGDEGVSIISKDGLKADRDSLERMVMSLSADKLGYNSTQLAELSLKIKEGDLTPVLQIYEADIKSPLRNALTGSLVRSLLIQIQKAKVDLDVAMTGINKLLRSQELTFAFVGVAPALSIVYLLGDWLKQFLFGSKETGKYGSRRVREHVWKDMRRVERLLNSSHHITPKRTEQIRSLNSNVSTGDSRQLEKHRADLLPPLTNGLIILSLTHLRSFAEYHLPAHSTMRDGFLEDVADLEDPDLGRDEKRRVVERMWRCWGRELGWGRI